MRDEAGMHARPLSQQQLEAALEESEQLTRGVLAAVPAGVVQVAADGSIRTANAEALHLLGLSYDELSQRYTYDFETETIWEDGSPCLARDYPVTRALRTGEPQTSPTIGVRRPDGALSWCDFRAVPVKDASTGAVTGAVVIFVDITERKRIEDALRRSEAELKAIVESAPSIIFTTDRQGRLTFINRVPMDVPATVDVLSVIGDSILHWINGRDRDRVEECLDRILNHQEIVELEGDGLDGIDPNTYSARLGPIVRDGEVVGIAGVVAVVNERRRAEQERAALLAQLNEARRLEALGRLAGGIAHDFNNLLTVIMGNMDMLLKRVEGTDQRLRLKEIAAASARASELTRQLLAFGRQQTLEPRAIDLGAVVDGVADMLRRLLGEHIELSIERVSELGTVNADPVEIERVIVNLAMNAQDAMGDGGTLVIATYNRTVEHAQANVRAGRYVALEVRDSGSGMDVDTRTRMFEPFFTTKEQGTGLGLATVHGIVAQSEGFIAVESEPSRGTRVCVLLPRVDNPSQPARDSEPRVTANGSETILLVEDDASVRNVARHVLEQEGYRVIVAEGAADALRLDRDELATVQLLVSDVVMPFVDGPTVASKLVKRAPHLKVLFMSGHHAEIRGELPRGSAFVEKPFDAPTLVAHVRATLDA
ncbi:MAG TPA: PAS domain-containing protein [Polyangiaceae bacterium]|nr:PAS domain-containing protein [Polyangiaceae bacterium]